MPDTPSFTAFFPCVLVVPHATCHEATPQHRPWDHVPVHIKGVRVPAAGEEVDFFGVNISHPKNPRLDPPMVSGE